MKFVTAALLFLLAASAPEVRAEKNRVALVIGNERYESAAGALRNTREDARSIAATLRALGFATTERYDLNRDQLLEAVEGFRKKIGGAEVALLYYAGHGLSIAGQNYLVPVKSGFDPAAGDATTLRMLAETRLFNVEQAVADMSAAGADCNLVILDACRNTPLARSAQTRNMLNQSGLAEMTPPAGSLIAFATDAGKTAFDGDGSNGLYTEELLKHLRMPNLTIEQVFKRTRAGVVKRSEGGQVPAEYSRLIGDDIYLAGREETARAEATPPDETSQSEEVPPEILDLLKKAQEQGPGDYAAVPLGKLLEEVKDTLSTATGPSSRVVGAATTCELVVKAIPETLPKEHAAYTALMAKAHNRRGDALLLLGRPEEAVDEFSAALALTPNDAYILYNRGRAHLTLNRKDEARKDLRAATNPRLNQPKARQLAEGVLAGIKD